MGNQPVTGRILLRGGMVADGVGATIRRADVLIDDGVIAAVGGAGGLGEVGAVGGVDGSPADCEVVDLAAGSVICPGFIDAHAHAEGPLLDSGVVLGALAQGVTTLVVGQDGESWIGAKRGDRPVPELVFRAGEWCFVTRAVVERGGVPGGGVRAAGAERGHAGVAGDDPA